MRNILRVKRRDIIFNLYRDERCKLHIRYQLINE